MQRVSLNKKNPLPYQRRNDVKKQMKESQEKNSRKGHLTPHTLRLIKLITTASSSQESVRESTQRAIVLLSKIASSSDSNILWDILARLYTSLTTPDESDTLGGGVIRRRNVALAMEHVAKYIPILDQKEFLLDNFLEEESNVDEAKSGDIETKEMFTKERYWLDVHDLVPDPSKSGGKESLLGQILDKGRLLLSCHESEFSKSGDEANDEYIIERDMLADLDSSFTTQDSRNEIQKKIQEFTKRRIALQRDILTRRLGLGGIISSNIVVQDDDIDQVVNDDELMTHYSCDDVKKRCRKDKSQSVSKNAMERNISRLQKRRRVEETTSDGTSNEEDEDENGSNSFIRNLLLLSIDSISPSKSIHTNSHRTPQHLLATDLVYHTFHPSWHVRHGALLGIGAILRSWYGSVLNKMKEGKFDLNFRFGKWPRDILARCFCILALDRFGDYSGECLDNDNVDYVDIAPVRSASAEVIALLFRISSCQILQASCLSILNTFSSNNNHWEIRHGSILVIKYILSVADDLNMQVQDDFFERAALSCLLDINDDVKSVCANVVSSIVSKFQNKSLDTQYFQNFVAKASQNIWKVLQTITSVASCRKDVLQCLIDLCIADSATVLSNIVSIDESEFGLSELMQSLCVFMDDTSPSIQVSCLKTISLIIEPSLDTMLGYIDTKKRYASLLDTLCSLLVKLFDSFLKCDSIDDIKEGEESMRVTSKIDLFRTRSWSAVIAALKLLMDNTKFPEEDTLRQTFILIAGRYFTLNTVGNCYKVSSKLGHPFHTRLTASKALISAFEKLHGNVDGVESCLAIATLAMQQSPLLEHCELANILLHSTNFEDRFQNSLIEIYKKYITNTMEKSPTSLLINNHDAVSEYLQSEDIRTAILQILMNALKERINCHENIPEKISFVLNRWSIILRKVGIDITAIPNTNSPVSIESMRVSCSLSGALISLGRIHWPTQKLTPIIRPLITTIKNEDIDIRSRHAGALACKMISMLKISAENSHNISADKVLSNIAMMASVPIYRENITRKGFTSKGCRHSKFILQNFLESMDKDEDIQSINPIWKLVQPVVDSAEVVQENAVIEEAISLLSCITKALKISSLSTNQIVSKALVPTVKQSCTSSSLGVRHDAIETVKNLCLVDIDLCSTVVFTLIKQYAESIDEAERFGSYSLLNKIVSEGGIKICPYVRLLLPLTMASMTDPVRECADIASSTFSHLVRLAPLVECHAKSGNDFLDPDSDVEKVIDHLILGKPLPPSAIADDISECLKKQGIVLRKYQIEGVSWLQLLKNVKLSGILADEMGLGKTLQALISVAMVHRGNSFQRGEDKSIIICPSSVVGQWMKELSKTGFMGNIFRVLQYTGSSRTQEWDRNNSTIDLVVTSYAVMRSDMHILKEIGWTYVVLDEGHLLKNPKTKTAQAARQIKAKHKILLSGTPVHNHVKELWAAFDWLLPNYLGNNTDFSRKYASAISRGNLPGATSSEMRESTEKLKQLHQQVLPFILRREKMDVLDELPPKIIIDVPCTMTKYQHDLYTKITKEKEISSALKAVNVMSDDTGDGNIDETAVQHNVFKSLLNLRLLCTHPLLINFQQREKTEISRFDLSGKLLALNDILRNTGIVKDEITAADNDESLLYIDDNDSIFERTDEKITNSSVHTDIFEVGNDQMGPRISHSKCLIFCQFSSSIDIIEKLLFQPHMPTLSYVRLDGNVNAAQRSKIIDAFQLDDDIKCMLLTTRIGSLGLNLQAADTVIFLESDWNPQVDLQAMDRTHRIGQKQSVKVYRLITKDSVEEKIMQIQKIKMEMSQAIVNTENSTIFSMGTDRLLDLFTTN